MSGRIQLEIDGLAELQAALRKLPVDCSMEAARVVREESRAFYDELLRTYPVGPARKRYAGGNLRKGVTYEIYEGRGGATAVVKSRAKHAWIYEHGTVSRETKGKGKYKAGVPRGAMPRTDLFVKGAIKYRRRMYERLLAFVRSIGLEVNAAFGRAA